MANFNPRAPCGARRIGSSINRRLLGFQSARPVRGATTLTVDGLLTAAEFQSARPVRGATRMETLSAWASCYFNPRAPCGARLYTAVK